MMVIGSVFTVNGATLPQANVYVSSAQGAITGDAIGTITNPDGDYIINVDPGEYLTASYVGFKKQTKLISVNDGIVSFELESATNIPQVTITAKRGQPVNWKLIIAAIIIAAIIYYYLYY